MAAPTFVASYATPFAVSSTKSVSVTVAAGDVLVVVGMTETNSITLGTPTGGGLTYTLRQSVVVSDYCTAYLWTATAGSAQTFTLSSTASASAYGGLVAQRFSGSDGIGASSKTNTASGAPSLGLTTTGANSAIVAGVGDWNAIDGASRSWRTVNSITPVAGDGERLYARDASRATAYAAYWSDAGAAGAKTVGLSAPTGQKYSIVAVEVLGSSAPGAQFVTPSSIETIEAVGSPTVEPGPVTIGPAGIAAAETFGTATVTVETSGLIIVPTGIPPTGSVGTPTIIGGARLQPPGVLDLVVEVRDVTLARVGQILRRDLNLRWTQVHNGVGEWTLTLPADHRLAAALRAPGSGLIVTGPDGLTWSGPAAAPTEDADANHPRGMLTIKGVTDDVILADATAWPDPTNGNITTQAAAYDTRTGPAETVMRGFVNANVGPSAPSGRRGLLAQALTLAADQARGPTITKNARFVNLAELLTECASTGLGWRVVQVGEALEFQVYEVLDRSSTVRLDVLNGDLVSQSAGIAVPDVTHVIVAGQGEGAARTLLQRTSTASLAASVAWGRIRERFLDQRQTNDTGELEQAGDEELATGGLTGTKITAVPADVLGKRYLREWREGDQLAVVVWGQELPVLVTSAELVASADAVRVSAVLGDPTGFDPLAFAASRQAATERRVSALERAT